MADITESQYYKIEYTIRHQDSEYQGEDIYNLYHIRCAYSKTSSFAFLTLPVEHLESIKIKDELQSANKIDTFPEISIRYKVVDHKKTEGARDYKALQILTEKVYNIIYCEALDQQKINSQKDTNMVVTCRLLLVHPILHFLETTNLYNLKKKDLTPEEMLKDYTGWLTGTFKDTFNIENLYEAKNLNKYKYEQLLVRTKNDLLVPKHINDQFKIWNQLGFSFFDDFNLDDNVKDVTLFNICLNNPKLFPQIDIHEDMSSDFIYGTKLVKQRPLSDIHAIFNEENSARFIVRNREGYHEVDPLPGPGKIPSMQISNNAGNVSAPRAIIANLYDKMNQEYKAHVDTYKLYTPDTVGNAMERFSNTTDLFKNKIAGFYEYRSDNIHADAFSFGYTYNLDLTKRSDFAYTPLAICNIFYKLEPKTILCKHSSQIQFLKYFIDKF